ncbi:hypothetical protein VMCG_10773 [Cytospora schulzeri]|uniref:Methyltransferase domain-containing protein n=1 Tax=Cytospora schulzeri TaxID=448051 RepID=A0A423V814_9PEZI|nr:hypothetical protein VMCG_10773 [Valsa malicola]
MPDIYAEKMTRTMGEGQRNIGYLIHPRIAAALPSNPRVADIGTGTGHFLQCLQKLYPDAILDGYDVSSAMYPDKTPANVSLKVLDMKKPVPEELHGKYDLVHARMMVAAVLPGEWTSIVSNLAQLIRPGGWIQWEECDFLSSKYLRGEKLETSRVDTVVETSHKWREEMRERFQCGWSTLPADMRAAGLLFTESDCVSSDRLPETRKKTGMNGMAAIFAWLRMMSAKGVPGSMSTDDLAQAQKRA